MSVRQAMAVLHTWTGVVLGSVLFAIFWMGTLSVFDREIDRWMLPATRLGPPPPALSLDASVRPRVDQLAAGVEQWSVVLPTPRTPTLVFRYTDADEASQLLHLDPVTGNALSDAGSLGGTGFIFPFHFGLHLGWHDLGTWLVGLCGMAMLVLVVSGVVIHRRIFKDMFTFRPKKVLSRSSLDLHNVLGVLALPFHFVMPLSGLIIFSALYFPGTWHSAYAGDRSAFSREVQGNYQRPKAGAPGALGSLDEMAAEAERRFGGGKPYFLRVAHVGDAASYVELRRSHAADVSMNRDRIYFDAATGTVLGRSEAPPVQRLQRFIAGIHFVQFDNWLIRWLYFGAGLAGCVLIATGFLFWLESRRSRHVRQGLVGVRVVEALSVGSVLGILLGTLAFFVANRVLPADLSIAGASRASLEAWVFYLVWLSSFVHAAWRRRSALQEQCHALGALALGALILNGLTTGDHLGRTLSRGSWSVAGMDLLLLLGGLLAFAVARRLRSQRGAEVAAPEVAHA
jgi:uncharacterized iron-regulated membrane protein